MFAVSIYNCIFQLFWNGKDCRIKITNGKIINTFPFADLFADLASKFHDLGTNECLRKMREFHAGKHFLSAIIFGRDKNTYPAKIRDSMRMQEAAEAELLSQFE